MKCITTKHTNVKRYTEEFPDVEKISTEVVNTFEVAKGIELSNNTNITTTANHVIMDENTELVHINSVAHSSESLAVENLSIKYDRKTKAVKEKTHEICGKTPSLTRLSSTKFKEINGVNKVVFIGTNDQSKFYEYDDKGRLIEETIEYNYKESNEAPTAPKTEKTSYRYTSFGKIGYIEKYTVAVNGQCKASFLDNFIEDYEYDDKNNLIKVTKTCVPITDGERLKVIKTGAYDHKNRLVEKTSSVLKNGHRDSDIVVHIKYDYDGRAIKMVSDDKTYRPDGSVRNTVTCQMDVHYVTHSDDTVTETRKLVYYNEAMDKNRPRRPVIITTKYRPGAPLSKTFNDSLLVTKEGFSGTIYNDNHETQPYIISQTESEDNNDTFTLNKSNTFSDDGKLIEGKTDRETFSESFKYEYNSNSDKPTMIEYSDKNAMFETTTKTEYVYNDINGQLISKFVTFTLNDKSSEEYALDKVMSTIQSVSKDHIKEIISSLGLRFDNDKMTM